MVMVEKPRVRSGPDGSDKNHQIKKKIIQEPDEDVAT